MYQPIWKKSFLFSNTYSMLYYHKIQLKLYYNPNNFHLNVFTLKQFHCVKTYIYVINNLHIEV